MRSPVARTALSRAGRRRAAALARDVPALLRVEVELGPRLARLGCELLGELDAVDEAPARRAQRELGVDVDDARDVDDGEEEVAELGEHARVGLRLGRGPAGAGELDLDLGELLPHLRERPVEVGPVEARPWPPGAAPCGRGAARAAPPARRGRSPERPSCSVLIASHRSRTRPAESASASPKTCGWRRTSLACTARATASRSPWPCSSSSRARK